MKSAKSNKSLRSIKSARSIRTNLGSKKGDAGGEFLDLANILPMACAKFQCPYSIVVKKEHQNDEYYKSIKQGDATPRQKKKLSIMPQQQTIVSQHSVIKASDDGKSLETELSIDMNTLTVLALYDTYNCLSQILLSRIKVPRILMQVMGLLVPYFQNLTTLSVRQCRIDAYTIHEIAKMLEISTITSICLENSQVLERNYAALLNESSGLRNLTLCRCEINDEDCKLLSAKLHHKASAENLQLLNLSSNRITDIGAKYISDALRSNRRLRYLNLADNRITDHGAGYILDVLIEFPLTVDEIMEMRRRFVKYLKCKQTLYLKYLNETDRSFDELSVLSRKSTAKRKKSTRKDKDSPRKLYSDDDVRHRAEMLATEILGYFTDPFDSHSIIRRKDYYYCVGNMVLSYLNLSYNNLSFFIIKKLQDVVIYQSYTKKSNQSGLLKAVIDGNNLPVCKELNMLNELFNRNIISGKSEIMKRKIRRESRLY